MIPPEADDTDIAEITYAVAAKSFGTRMVHAFYIRIEHCMIFVFIVLPSLEQSCPVLKWLTAGFVCASQGNDFL